MYYTFPYCYTHHMDALEKHKLSRGDILISFSAAEELIGYYIAENVTSSKKTRDLFVGSVIAQPLFSFELKKKIFYDLLKKKGLYKEFPRDALEDMQWIRNRVAHGSVHYNDFRLPSELQQISIGFGGQTYDIDELSTKFKSAEKILSSALINVFFEDD